MNVAHSWVMQRTGNLFANNFSPEMVAGVELEAWRRRKSILLIIRRTHPSGSERIFFFFFLKMKWWQSNIFEIWRESGECRNIRIRTSAQKLHYHCVIIDFVTCVTYLFLINTFLFLKILRSVNGIFWSCFCLAYSRAKQRYRQRR